MFPSVRLAQNLLETGGVIHPWYNLGGIKVGNSKPNQWWNGTSVNRGTWEVYDGKRVDIEANFRAYVSVYCFYKDQDLLFENARYKRVKDSKSPQEQAKALYLCGYATDPNYAGKIINIINDYGLTKYDEEAQLVKTVITKERIRLLTNGNIIKIPIGTEAEKRIAYANPGTDVRTFKLDKSKVRLELVVEKGAKVSALVKKHGADLGFNFPFFDPPARVPIGYVWNDGKYINGAYGEMKEWYELGIKGGSATIGKFTNAQREAFDFSVQGKILIVSGSLVWKNDGQKCQRTFAWIDAAGDLTMAIADGRTGGDDGLTCEEMALYAKSKGAVYALEGDGGGSTIIADQTGGLNQSFNTGSNERTVHHAVLVYYLNVSPPTVPTPGYEDSDNITYGDLKKLGLI